MADMSSLISLLRSLLPEFENTIRSFTASKSRFKLIRTINAEQTQQPPLRTLYILDSSFNPPTTAHMTLAASALKDAIATDAGPCRLLLLFSTHNADKTPDPAGFAQRLALMTALAQDLSQTPPFKATSPSPLASSKPTSSHTLQPAIPIDIGLTTEPYYTSKTDAIAHSPSPYPIDTKHIHILGYDTLTRFLNPKYYPDDSPRLSALAPYFTAGHGLRASLRPTDADDESSKAFGGVEAQEAFIRSLAEGALEDEGWKREWAGAVEVVKAEGAGISSSRVRMAVKEDRWVEVQELCGEGVAEWVREARLYSGEGTG